MGCLCSQHTDGLRLGPVSLAVALTTIPGHEGCDHLQLHRLCEHVGLRKSTMITLGLAASVANVVVVVVALVCVVGVALVYLRRRATRATPPSGPTTSEATDFDAVFYSRSAEPPDESTLTTYALSADADRGTPDEPQPHDFETRNSRDQAQVATSPDTHTPSSGPEQPDWAEQNQDPPPDTNSGVAQSRDSDHQTATDVVTANDAGMELIEPVSRRWTGPLANGGSGAVWVNDERPSGPIFTGVWMERVDGRGEDAPPTLIAGDNAAIGLVGVYDGTGGAGAGLAGVGNDGTVHTGAWLASRAVRAATESWFADELAGSGSTQFAETLRTALHDRLTTEMHQVASSSRLAGTLRRDLPTTMAAAAYRMRKESNIEIVSMWVGDSRVFVLTPSAGLQQTTTDDSGANDALAALVDDPPMTNMISASGDFTVNATRITIQAPAVVISATDGCFGYVATPAHFEVMVLRALAGSSDQQQWMISLLEAIDTVTSDDASLAAATIGFDDHEQLRGAFSARLQALEAEHWDPYEHVDHTDHAQLVAFRQQSWGSYRVGYEALLETGA